MADRYKIKRKYVFAVIYSLFIIAFTVYILLDTYVIRKEYETVNIYYDSGAGSSPNGQFSDTSYSDDNISVEISEIRRYDTTIHVAKIKLNDAKYLKTALAEDTFGRNILDKVSSIAKNKNAIFAINGDYYGWKTSGFVLRNGVIYRDTKQKDSQKEDLVIYKDGRFEIINESISNINQLAKDGAWQILSFGPAILKNGAAFKYNNSYDEIFKIKNPRTSIGIIDKLNYIVLVADGRYPNEAGVTIEELANIFLEYGAKDAYNLDGGGSSVMWFNGKVINKPVNGKGIIERSVSDIVYIGY